MTRLLMTADTLGGVWTFATDLAEALTHHGVEVTLATMGRRMTDAQRARAAEAGVTAVYESDFALEWMPEPWAEVDAAGDWLLQIADAVRPDLVHLNGYVHAALPWTVPVVVVGHSCVLSWWSAVYGEPAPEPEWTTYRSRVGRGLLAADAVVAPTAAMLRELERIYGVRSDIVMPNGRRNDVSDVDPDDKEPLILAAGRVWDASKNLHRLAEISYRLPWTVAIAGDATPPDGQPPNPDHRPAFMLGELDWPALERQLRRAAIYVAPSSYEPFGLGPLEAAQRGCALVVGDIPSLREVWADAAHYVDPRDPESIVAAVTHLVARPPELRGMAEAARARAARYTSEACATAYLRLYRQLADHRAQIGVGSRS